jgi:hypothetical protein
VLGAAADRIRIDANTGPRSALNVKFRKFTTPVEVR